MKIPSVKAYSCFVSAPAFTSGVINCFSDFDGTYMPYKYSHDVICRDGCAQRESFLKNKKPFQEYFDGFSDFFKKAKGKNGDKFNFIITTGRNRQEYNYCMKKIKEDGLSLTSCGCAHYK